MKGQNGVAILNDAYNASPIAMKSVIKSFVSVDAAGRRPCSWGHPRTQENIRKNCTPASSEVISPNEVALVYLYGEEMEALYDALKDQFDSAALHHYMDKEALIVGLEGWTQRRRPKSLSKSSNGRAYSAVVDALKKQNNKCEVKRETHQPSLVFFVPSWELSIISVPFLNRTIEQKPPPSFYRLSMRCEYGRKI